MGLFKKDDKPKQDFKEKCMDQIKEFLLAGEVVEGIYPLVIDFLCITNKRLLFVDKDISFKEPKTTIYSITYNNITGIGLEKNEKVFAFTDVISIVTRGKTFDLKFIKGTNLVEIYNGIMNKIV
ncbi:MAG: PH domain-containing protein [Clostridiaceae bacterium]